MHIESSATSFPDRVVTNDDLLAILEKRAAKSFQGNLQATLRKIGILFKKSGIRQRRWLAPDETSFDHLENAIRSALMRAQLMPSDIDMLIYASVDKQVREPGHAFLIAKAMGMYDAQCFDILEACASWVRASQISDSLLRANATRNVMVVTSEFNCHEDTWGFQNYRLEKEVDLEWTFPAFTIGEGASATIFTADGEKPWHFDFEGKPRYSDLCLAPIGDVYSSTTHSIGDVNLAGKGQSRFVSYASSMEEAGVPLIRKLMERNWDRISKSDLIVPHSHTKKTWLQVADSFQAELPYFFIYPDYGNLVTGSIPTGLSLAVESNSLQRGDEVMGMMTAAGLSFANISFTY